MRLTENHKKPSIVLMTSKCDRLAHDSVAPAMGLIRLRHAATKRGYPCEVLDFQVNSEEQLLLDVENGKYDIIGQSVSHWNILDDLDLHWKLRDAAEKSGKKCLFLAGGNPATQETELWLNCGVDLIAMGFCEDTLPEIAERYSEGRPGPIWDVYKDMDGVSFLNEAGLVVRNDARLLTEEKFVEYSYTHDMEMNNPYPVYWEHVSQRMSSLLNMNGRSYIVENGRLYTTSHCAAACGFCDCPSFLKSAQGAKTTVLRLSPEQVLNLIVHHANEFGAKSFSFNDENWLVGNKAGYERAIDICNLIIDAKQKGIIPQDIKFSNQARGWDYIDFQPEGRKEPNHRLLNAMAGAGFHNMSLGIETFSDRLLKSRSIAKGGVRAHHYHMVLKAIMDHNLFPTINMIMGIPETEPEELIETIRHALHYIEKPCQLSIAHRMYAFPGAPIWDREEYPTAFHKWTHPKTGEIVEIPHYYIPHNPTIAKLIPTLEDASWEEIDGVRKRAGWSKDLLVPRMVNTLCTFMAVARGLDQKDLFEEINTKLDGMIAEQKRADVDNILDSMVAEPEAISAGG